MPGMEGEHQYYRRPHGYHEGSSFELSPDVMSKQEFGKLDIEQEEFLIKAAEPFPITPEDEELKYFASDHLNERFKKGDRQFAAAGRAERSYRQPLVRLQQDYRLGNTNTCSERLLEDTADNEGITLADMVTYRGENIESLPVDHPWVKEARKLQTLQERGGVADKNKKNVMRHMVVPCAYCREGFCHHNQTGMIIMPPGILDVSGKDKNTIKLPAFMAYPEDDLFQKDDPLLRKLKASDNNKLFNARKEQKQFFKDMAKRYPLTEKDMALVLGAHEDMNEAPLTEDPYVLIRGRSITDQTLDEGGEIEPEPKRYRYLEYKRDDVALRFIDEVLEIPRLPTDTAPRGSSQALHVFMELYREPGGNRSKLILPNADTRQRIIERFPRAFFLMAMDGEVVKLPMLLLYPNRYKRFDKNQGRV